VTDIPDNNPAVQPTASSQSRPQRGRPFQEGQSGNKRGRPRKLSPEIDFRAVILTELTRNVSMPGIKGRVPAVQAVVRSAILSAAKGNSRSQHDVLKLYREVCREREVLRDVIRAAARWSAMSVEQVVDRLRQAGIEMPGNFETIHDIISEQRVRDHLRTISPLFNDADDSALE
jgi:hypothetical protein